MANLADPFRYTNSETGGLQQFIGGFHELIKMPDEDSCLRGRICRSATSRRERRKRQSLSPFWRPPPRKMACRRLWGAKIRPALGLPVEGAEDGTSCIEESAQRLVAAQVDGVRGVTRGQRKRL